jgi:hypothetical protein
MKLPGQGRRLKLVDSCWSLVDSCKAFNKKPIPLFLKIRWYLHKGGIGWLRLSKLCFRACGCSTMFGDSNKEWTSQSPAFLRAKKAHHRNNALVRTDFRAGVPGEQSGACTCLIVCAVLTIIENPLFGILNFQTTHNIDHMAYEVKRKIQKYFKFVQNYFI